MNKYLLVLIALLLSVVTSCNEDQQPDPVQAPKEESKVFASFAIENPNCRAPCKVSFSNLSKNAGTYKWQFGDGDTLNDKNVSHIYTKGGTYTVTLVAQKGSEWDVVRKQLSVKDKYQYPKIQRVTVHNFPQKKSNGEDWDDFSKPDVRFEINEQDGVQLISSFAKDDAEQSDLPFRYGYYTQNYGIKRLSVKHNFIIEDDDNPNDETMKKLTFSPDTFRQYPNPYPKSITLKENAQKYATIDLKWQ